MSTAVATPNPSPPAAQTPWNTIIGVMVSTASMLIFVITALSVHEHGKGKNWIAGASVIWFLLELLDLQLDSNRSFGIFFERVKTLVAAALAVLVFGPVYHTIETKLGFENILSTTQSRYAERDARASVLEAQVQQHQNTIDQLKGQVAVLQLQFDEAKKSNAVPVLTPELVGSVQRVNAKSFKFKKREGISWAILIGGVAHRVEPGMPHVKDVNDDLIFEWSMPITDGHFYFFRTSGGPSSQSSPLPK